MENNSNRRTIIIVALVLLFSVCVLVWYFFYAKPVIQPSIGETVNPIGNRDLPVRGAFLTWGKDEKQTTVTEVTDPRKDPLIQVWKKPATGQTFVPQVLLEEINATTTEGTSTITIKKTVRATSTVLLFVDKTTGYIYGYPLKSGTVFQVSNTIIPGVHDAYFFDNGSRVIIRYIDREKNTVVGLIAKVPTPQEKGQALPLEEIEYLTSQILSVAVNQAKNQAAYLVTTDAGSAIYTIISKKPTLLTTSPFTEWTLSYGGDTLFATTKPSAYVPGITVSLPSFQSELGEKTGLMTLPGENNVLLNSMWGAKGLVSFISQNGNITLLASKTLTQKCAWGKRAFLICAVPNILPRSEEGLPDDWFQGRISFDDSLEIVNPSTGESSPLFFFPKDAGTFDVTNITLAEENTLLSFIKKQNGSLWLLNTTLLPRE